jgi:serine protease
MTIRFMTLTSIAAAVLALANGTIAGHAQVLAQKVCPPCAAIASVQGSLDKLPREVLGNQQWALGARGVNVPWKPFEKLPPDNKRVAGEGATVVQIDTGVTNHPLLAAATVDVHAADDLFGPGHRNIDLLLSGFLRFPGHGTKTASVIVGRAADLQTGIVGVAPGVHLIPVRATEGVLLFGSAIGELNADQHRVARALNEAARGRAGLFNRDVDVISMSLGGWPPTDDLCAAVAKATDAGVIVIVAAGNEVRRAVYPARCPTAIAVAGSTYNEEVWSGSAGHETVAIAAPAEGVWTAAVMNGVSCIESSSGTSFATALVAGLAAEWSVRHPRTAETQASRHHEFRKALQQSARPWKKTSWARKYGAGIVDATKLF